MKTGWKIALATGGIVGLGLYIWSRIGQAKEMIANLQVSPMWYGGINDMKIDLTKGVKLPLAVDFMNRSDAKCKVRLNSLDVVNNQGKTIAYTSAGNFTAEIRPYETTRMKDLEVWIAASTVYTILGSSIASIINGNGSSAKSKLKELVDGCVIKISLTANEAFTVTLEIPLGGSAVVDEKDGVQGLGIVCAEKREIRPLSEYSYLLPPQENLLYEDPIEKKNVSPEDTAKFIREVARKYKSDTEVLAKYLRCVSKEETVQNIWNFVAKYIKYTMDNPKEEQVRRPLRTLYDQKGDCDCYATLIASICENLGLRYVVRIAEYDKKGYFQHVYVIIENMCCDPVVHKCFYEKAPTRVKDF